MWILLFQLAIAIYGGYFGGGMGIMMLAAFSIAGMADIHEMNGLKTLLAVAINGVALVEFIVTGAIAWAPGLIMVAGGIVGGYYGAFLARQIDGARRQGDRDRHRVDDDRSTSSSDELRLEAVSARIEIDDASDGVDTSGRGYARGRERGRSRLRRQDSC